MFPCVLGGVEGLLRLWFMYFPSSPKMGKLLSSMYSSEPDHFPWVLSSPCLLAWTFILQLGRGWGRHPFLVYDPWSSMKSCFSIGGTTHFAPLSPSVWSIPCLCVLQILVLRPEPPIAPLLLQLLEWLHGSYLTLQGPWVFMIWTYPYPSTSQLEDWEKAVKTNHLDLLDSQESTTN